MFSEQTIFLLIKDSTSQLCLKLIDEQLCCIKLHLMECGMNAGDACRSTCMILGCNNRNKLHLMECGMNNNNRYVFNFFSGKFFPIFVFALIKRSRRVNSIRFEIVSCSLSLSRLRCQKYLVCLTFIICKCQMDWYLLCWNVYKKNHVIFFACHA